MKIYRFNPETGLYLGEDFADDASMRHGEFKIPPDATTIMPPAVECGQVPVYLVGERRWAVQPRSTNGRNE
ncbi:hypothetical protein [Geobacter pickeringii]|uniref:Tail fiber assembly protein n=1 Tax=Geobacter pickeringii TaxID=345632 RepID=A0A0B5BEI0_9BACT|nr:hypothetical protein [Geobacter pickeringii]AJE03569.1 hypothetical protein GPICK_09570 [Geobacter pickeringii]